MHGEVGDRYGPPSTEVAPVPAKHTPMEPAQLGPYTIGTRLGRGGMGAVYEAVDTTTGASVAVKVLAAHLADDPGLKARFRDEIETLKELRHPGIVQLLAYGEEGDQPYFAMELVRGKTIEQALRGGRRFTWQETVAAALAISRALKVAHDHGVIHRDLKPSNILLADDVPIGEGVKLADFGIAKLFGGASHTAHGNIVGTAEYMAPEQATGAGIDHRADLYSLGLVMYAMLAGRPPFRGGQATEVIAKQRNSPAPRIADAVPAVPPELDTLIDRLLQKAPASRPASALALARLLTAIATFVPTADRIAPAGDKLVIADLPAPPTRGEQKGMSGDFTTVYGTNAPAPHAAAASPEPSPAPSESPPAPSPRATEGATAGSGEEAPKPRAVRRPTGGSGGAPTAGIDRDLTGLPKEGKGADTRVDTTVRRQHTSMADLERVDRERRFRDQTRQTWAGVAMAIAIAATVLGGGWMLLRPPTADSLYARIKAVSDDDDGDLRDADELIRRFLDRHSDDPRVSEVAGFARSIALDRLERRARRKLRGDRPLLPIERDYRAAMAREPESPSGCLAALEAFVTLHQPVDQAGEQPGEDRQPDAPHPPITMPSGDLEDDTGLWIALAHRQIARLTPLALDEQQEDRRRIEAILADAEALSVAAADDPSRRQDALATRRLLLASIVDTYAGRAHVSTLVERATTLLAEIAPATPTESSPGAEAP
jgi:serine/threonine-protein kinase